jgi:hypothetical protein
MADNESLEPLEWARRAVAAFLRKAVDDLHATLVLQLERRT